MDLALGAIAIIVLLIFEPGNEKINAYCSAAIDLEDERTSEKAAYHINKYLENRGRGIGIRAAVKTTGCSGLMYVIEPVDRLIEEDLKFESYGVDIFVDPKSLIYLKGTEMDYVKKGLNEGFEFKNPNVKTECGCGESFVV